MSSIHISQKLEGTLVTGSVDPQVTTIMNKQLAFMYEIMIGVVMQRKY
jgi:hypothetical protein